jgi:uncharacterized protein
MKFLVISDTHGNLARLRHVTGFAKHARLDGIIHCGDWDNAEAAMIIKDTGLPLYAILGNADEPQAAAIWKIMKECPGEIDIDVLETTLGNRKVAITHQPYKVTKQLASGEFDALFFGHTHQMKNENKEKTLLLNPGAMQRTPTPTFAVYDSETNSATIIEVPL